MQKSTKKDQLTASQLCTFKKFTTLIFNEIIVKYFVNYSNHV